MSRNFSAAQAAAEPGDEVTRAVVFEKPEQLALRWIALPAPGPDQVVVDVEFSGISTGTEKLLWSGEMPPFPGMGYPLVPGYETVGRVVRTGANAASLEGRRVFVSGASCYGDVNGLFGGAASRLLVDASRVTPLGDAPAEEATLLALAATAHHALFDAHGGIALPDLIVGHGVLGRLLARLSVVLGGDLPTVWETNPSRVAGSSGYRVLHPDEDERRDYRRIIDVSGDATILDSLIARLAKQGEIVLAGFYAQPLSFTFPPAFMREARIRAAAEWQATDLAAVSRMLCAGELPLDGLITHRARAEEAPSAYPLAFSNPDCLKMVLDWRPDA